LIHIFLQKILRILVIILETKGTAVNEIKMGNVHTTMKLAF